MVEEKSSLAANVVLLFAVATMAVIGLGFLEEIRWITTRTEGLIRFLIGFLIHGALVAIAFRVPVSKTYRLLVLFGCVSVQAEYLLSYTEDVPRFSDVPVLGANSQIRAPLEKALPACWMFVALVVAYTSIRSVQESRAAANQYIRDLEESESRVQASNATLKQTIEQLNSTQQQLVKQERLRVIGEMASGVAHDLNNALTPLVASSQLLSASLETPTEKQAYLANLIEQSAFDVSSIVEKLNQLHQHSGRHRRTPANLKDLIEQVVAGTQAKWKTEPELRGVEIRVDVHATDIHAEIDVTEIRAVLTNLLFNSVQSMPDGGCITIKLWQEDTDAVISMADTGIGMTSEELDQCRNAFFTTKSSGSGLGLSMCSKIIEGYGAGITIQSSHGAGTTATFRLPTTSERPAPPGDGQLSLHHKRILIVEDNHNVRSVIDKMLVHLGAEVESVADGKTAISRFRDTRFDLVITDFGMPGLTGADIIRAIRELRPEQRIAVLSGWSGAEVNKRFFPDFEPDAILQKPVDLQALETLLSS